MSELNPKTRATLAQRLLLYGSLALLCLVSMGNKDQIEFRESCCAPLIGILDLLAGKQGDFVVTTRVNDPVPPGFTGVSHQLGMRSMLPTRFTVRAIRKLSNICRSASVLEAASVQRANLRVEVKTLDELSQADRDGILIEVGSKTLRRSQWKEHNLEALRRGGAKVRIAVASLLCVIDLEVNREPDPMWAEVLTATVSVNIDSVQVAKDLGLQ